MKYVPEATMDRIKTLTRQILNLQTALSNQITEYNYKAEELYDDLIDRDKRTYDEYAEELNTLTSNVQQQMQAFFDEQEEEWQDSKEGKAYTAWLEAWGFEIHEFEVEDFEPLTEPTLLEAEEFAVFTADPGDIEFPEDGRMKASLERQKLLEEWKSAVLHGTTSLGFTVWCSERQRIDAWKIEVQAERTQLGFLEWVEAQAKDAAVTSLERNL